MPPGGGHGHGGPSGGHGHGGHHEERRGKFKSSVSTVELFSNKACFQLVTDGKILILSSQTSEKYRKR
jgi:hypothetical protein